MNENLAGQPLIESYKDIVIFHVDQIITGISSTGAYFLGVSAPSCLIGRPIVDIVHPRFRVHVRNRIEEVIRTGTYNYPERQALVTIAGEVVEVEAFSIPVVISSRVAVQSILRMNTPAGDKECSFCRSCEKTQRLSLTKREYETIGYIKEGRSTKEIAAAMCLSEKCVSFHRNNIRRKLNLRERNISLSTYLKTFY